MLPDSFRTGRIRKNPPDGGFLSLNSGFTLVELVVTMIVIGILAATVLPRFSGNSGFEEREFRDRLAAALRYAQKSAIAARRTTCVTFSNTPAKATFAVSKTYGAADCTDSVGLVGPDSKPLSVTAASGVDFPAVPATIVFDAAGRPNAAASIAINGLPATLNIAVEAETGYVH